MEVWGWIDFEPVGLTMSQQATNGYRSSLKLLPQLAPPVTVAWKESL